MTVVGVAGVAGAVTVAVAAVLGALAAVLVGVEPLEDCPMMTPTINATTTPTIHGHRLGFFALGGSPGAGAVSGRGNGEG